MSRKYDKEIVKNGMLILDCTSETQEKKSEGLLVRELVRILKPKIQPRVVTIRGVSSFIHELKNSSEKLIHISAHGRFYCKNH